MAERIEGRHPRAREGKTAKDKKNGHIPYRKNTKPQGERGHRTLVSPDKGGKKR